MRGGDATGCWPGNRRGMGTYFYTLPPPPPPPGHVGLEDEAPPIPPPPTAQHSRGQRTMGEDPFGSPALQVETRLVHTISGPPVWGRGGGG